MHILLGACSVMHCTFFVMQLDLCLFIQFDDPDEIHIVCGYPGSPVLPGW